MILRLNNFLYLSFVTVNILQITALNGAYDSPNLKTIMRNIISFRKSDGKINIPPHIKHVKLDIGLSYNAPMSQYWLSHENDLLVFGFEPNPAAIDSILQGASKLHILHGKKPFEKKFIGEQFFLIPCALGLSNNTMIKFFVTKDDCGCSSIYFPKDFSIERIIEVPIFSLASFFDLFPWDTHPVVDYIKIDAQGSDLDIVKSAGNYLVEKVIYITLEAEDSQYENTVNSCREIDAYMESIGFIRYKSSYTSDPTYFNPRYSDYIQNHNVQIYQKD